MKSPEKCRGCGLPLRQEHAWMVDGCPCNSPKGCNDGNQQISEWRAEEGNRLRTETEGLKAKLERETNAHGRDVEAQAKRIDELEAQLANIDSLRPIIESTFVLLIQQATASAVQTMQRVNDQVANIFAVTGAQLGSSAVKQEAVVQAIADAIRALPPDKLIEFVKATDANVTNINVGGRLPLWRSDEMLTPEQQEAIRTRVTT